MAVGLQQRVVLPVGQRHLLAVVQRNDRMLDVGVGQHRVDVVRRVAETARKRQQVLPFFVEHVLLLVIHALDGEPIHREIGVCGHPAAHGLERDAQQLGGEPRPGFRRFREQDLHLLPPGVRRVVALVLVVGQPGVIPQLVGQLTEIVVQPKRLEQPLRALARACRAAPHSPPACVQIR